MAKDALCYSGVTHQVQHYPKIISVLAKLVCVFSYWKEQNCDSWTK